MHAIPKITVLDGNNTISDDSSTSSWSRTVTQRRTLCSSVNPFTGRPRKKRMKMVLAKSNNSAVRCAMKPITYENAKLMLVNTIQE
jgi:hypothetical protein